jgi:hypothetical protein
MFKLTAGMVCCRTKQQRCSSSAHSFKCKTTMSSGKPSFNYERCLLEVRGAIFVTCHLRYAPLWHLYCTVSACFSLPVRIDKSLHVPSSRIHNQMLPRLCLMGCLAAVDPPIAAACEHGCVPLIVQLLQYHDFPDVQAGALLLGCQRDLTCPRAV